MALLLRCRKLNPFWFIKIAKEFLKGYQETLRSSRRPEARI
jgi:hypothetical protein